VSRSKDRADRIKAEIPLLEVLASYGYAVHPGGGDREQQFSCDLHGDGTDSKPSARAYPDTNQWYCFACATSRDAIQTVREKEGLDFRSACDLLERKFGLPPLPWDPEEDEAGHLDLESVLSVPIPTASDAQARVATLLRAMTRERSLPLTETLRLWEEHDKLATYLEKGSEGLLDEFTGLRDRLIRTLRSTSAA
jgi:DNA primase